MMKRMRLQMMTVLVMVGDGHDGEWHNNVWLLSWSMVLKANGYGNDKCLMRIIQTSRYGVGVKYIGHANGMIVKDFVINAGTGNMAANI